MEREMTRLKILVWDFQKDATQWLVDNIDNDKILIVNHMMNVDEMVNETMSCFWDYIFCFIPPEQKGIKGKFSDIFRRLGVSNDKVIYALDLEDWVVHKELAFYLLKGDIKNRMELYCEKAKKEFVTCTVDGISYVANSSDRVILDWMYMFHRNWADEEMQVFYRLSQKYYQVDSSKNGYFLDIGANIGTTCIYFKKKVDKNVDILAFEPESNNYKLLSTNLLLNGLDKVSVAENYGLSEKQEHRKLHINNYNPGQNSIIHDYGQVSEEIKMISLDEYLLQNGISADEIKYMWIDTEGFEPFVLNGGKNALNSGNFPVFMELNPYLWNAAGLYEKMMELLCKIYTKFIIIDEVLEGNESLHQIDELWQYREASQFFQSDIFLIK